MAKQQWALLSILDDKLVMVHPQTERAVRWIARTLDPIEAYIVQDNLPLKWVDFGPRMQDAMHAGLVCKVDT